MRYSRFTRYLLYLIPLFCLASGCQALHQYRPVVVVVRDAETKTPIPQAEVYLTYSLSRDSLAPCNSSGVTGQDGITRLRAVSYGKYGIQLQGIAQGYLSEEMSVATDAIDKVEPAHLFEAVDQRPVNFVVEMYSGPQFTVELIVPVSYRGLVKAEVQVQADAPRTAGQRCFRYEVSPSRDPQAKNPSLGVLVKGPSLLRRVTPSDYHAKYSDGTPLGEEMDDVKVGFRWLKAEGKEQYFVVGTQPEYETLRRRLVPEESKTENHPSGGGKGGGRGGRHHRGSQTSTE